MADRTLPPDTDPGAVARLRSILRGRGGMAALVLLTSMANVVNYASSLVFSRLLQPVGFGELTSLLALGVVLAVPLAAAQTVVAERVAVAHAARDEARLVYLVRYALGHVGVIAAAVGGLYLLSIPLLMSALDIRQPGPALALAPLIVVTFLNPVITGVLQGMQRFGALGILVAATAASRLLFGVPWVELGGGAGGAIAGQAVGLTVVSALVLLRYRKWLMPRGSGVARSGMKRRLDLPALSATGAFVGFALLSNMDLVLARLFLGAREAGIYAAVATVAKVMTFLPSAVATIMVPNAAQEVARTGSGSRTLKRAAGVIALAAALVAAPAVAFPDLAVTVMFGDGYEDAVAGVLPAVLAGSGLAMLYLLATYSVTVRDRRWVGLVAVGVVLQGGAIALFHGSPEEIAWVQAGVIAAVLVVNELLFHSVLPERRRA